MIRFQRERIYNVSGSPDRRVYKLKYSKETNADELVCIGKEPWQQMIDAAAPSCDIETLIVRVRNGELDALNQKQGTYGDFRDLPKSRAELLQTAIDARYMFNNLSEDQKKAFGSFGEFLENAGSPEWLKTLGVDVQSETKEEKEVSE